MEMLLADDRRSIRRSVVAPCQVIRRPGDESLGDLAIDLSTDGMLVLSNAPCLVGETMLVSFQVPGTERWIETTARVARVAEGRRHNDLGRAIGLLFEPLDVESHRLLRVALEGLPETGPARPARPDYAATAGLIALDE
jgi:hypothetical protein